MSRINTNVEHLIGCVYAEIQMGNMDGVKHEMDLLAQAITHEHKMQDNLRHKLERIVTLMSPITD